MNTLKGVIKEIHSHEGISLVKVNSLDKIMLTSVVIDDSETAVYLKIGNTVNIHFKETEVIIAKDNVLNISIQNQIPCIVKFVKIGEILCQSNLLSGETTIKSIITSNACKQLKLSEGDKVYALIKSNEISLSPND